MKKFVKFFFASLLFFLSSCSFIDRITNYEHEHKYDIELKVDGYIASPATCNDSATYFYACICGQKGSETYSSGDPLGHSYTNYVSNDDASCKKDGTKTAKCDRCTSTDTQVDVGSEHHVFNIKKIEDKYLKSAATCENKAVYFYSCECGEKGTKTFETGEPLGHKFTNYVPNNDWGCTTDGTKTAKCDRCDKTDTIADVGSAHHVFDKQIVSNKYLKSPTTCTHKAVYYYSCKCGEKGTETFEAGELLDHSFTNYVSNNDWGCTTDGTKTAKCDNCSVTNTITDVGSAHHIFDKQVISETYLKSDADCTHKAVYYYSCKCGEKGTETFEVGKALGHSFTNYLSNNDFDCTKDGTKTAKCDRCEVTDTVTDVGSAHHVFDNEVTTSTYLYSEATHASPAKYYYSCKCGEKGTETFEYGSSIAHNFNQTVENEQYLRNNATCTEKLSYYYSCSCGAKDPDNYFEVGSPLGHSFTQYFSDNNWTDTVDGTKTAKCDRCEATDTVTDVGSAHHVYDQQVVTNDHLKSAADCTHKAVYYYSCSCELNGTETFEYGDALNHSFTSYVSNNDWGCTTDGTKTAKCDRCSVTNTIADVGSAHHVFTVEDTGVTYLKSSADCTHKALYYYSCACGQKGTTTFEYGELLDHSFTSYVSNNDWGCTTDGTKTAKCDRCTATNTIADVGSAHHVYDQKVVNDTYKKSDATCTEKPLYYYSCKCGAKGTIAFESGSSLGGHSFTNYVNDNNATCTTLGTKTAKCDRCTATDTVDIPDSYEHNLVNHALTDYNGDSFTAKICSDCSYYTIQSGNNYFETYRGYSSNNMFNSFEHFTNKTDLQLFYCTLLENSLVFQFGNSDISTNMIFMEDYVDYDLTNDEALSCWISYRYDWPILYTVDYTYGSNSTTFAVYTVTDFYSHTARNAATTKLINGVTSLCSSFDKTKIYDSLNALYGTIINNTEYAYEAPNVPSTALNAHSAYGYFNGEDVVCEGYSKALQIVLNKMGVENIFVSGIGNGGAHAWSCIKVDGKWYMCDITWDDSYAKVFSKYNYFLMGQAEYATSDHTESTPYNHGGDYMCAIPTLASSKYVKS